MQKEKKQIKRLKWLEALRAEERLQSIPATASKYLHWLDEYHEKHPDMQVILYGRVSGRTQNLNDNADTYEDVLYKACREKNILALTFYPEVSSGWILDEDRYGLLAAIREAQKHPERHTVILAASTDRYLRNVYYKTTTPDLLPTIGEFKRLEELTCGVPLLTLLHPDMPPKDVRGIQSKWGQTAKGNKGGRPIKVERGYKKKLRRRKLLKVITMFEDGATVSDIMVSTDVKRSTINDWISKYWG